MSHQQVDQIPETEAVYQPPEAFDAPAYRVTHQRPAERSSGIYFDEATDEDRAQSKKHGQHWFDVIDSKKSYMAKLNRNGPNKGGLVEDMPECHGADLYQPPTQFGQSAAPTMDDYVDTSRQWLSFSSACKRSGRVDLDEGRAEQNGLEEWSGSLEPSDLPLAQGAAGYKAPSSFDVDPFTPSEWRREQHASDLFEGKASAVRANHRRAGKSGKNKAVQSGSKSQKRIRIDGSRVSKASTSRKLVKAKAKALKSKSGELRKRLDKKQKLRLMQQNKAEAEKQRKQEREKGTKSAKPKNEKEDHGQFPAGTVVEVKFSDKKWHGGQVLKKQKGAERYLVTFEDREEKWVSVSSTDAKFYADRQYNDMGVLIYYPEVGDAVEVKKDLDEKGTFWCHGIVREISYPRQEVLIQMVNARYGEWKGEQIKVAKKGEKAWYSVYEGMRNEALDPVNGTPKWPKHNRYWSLDNETPMGIAKRYGIPVEELMEINRETVPGLKKTSLLFEGTVLTLPEEPPNFKSSTFSKPSAEKSKARSNSKWQSLEVDVQESLKVSPCLDSNMKCTALLELPFLKHSLEKVAKGSELSAHVTLLQLVDTLGISPDGNPGLHSKRSVDSEGARQEGLIGTQEARLQLAKRVGDWTGIAYGKTEDAVASEFFQIRDNLDSFTHAEVYHLAQLLQVRVEMTQAESSAFGLRSDVSSAKDDARKVYQVPCRVVTMNDSKKGSDFLKNHIATALASPSYFSLLLTLVHRGRKLQAEDVDGKRLTEEHGGLSSEKYIRNRMVKGKKWKTSKVFAGRVILMKSKHEPCVTSKLLPEGIQSGFAASTKDKTDTVPQPPNLESAAPLLKYTSIGNLQKWNKRFDGEVSQEATELEELVMTGQEAAQDEWWRDRISKKARIEREKAHYAALDVKDSDSVLRHLIFLWKEDNKGDMKAHVQQLMRYVKVEDQLPLCKETVQACLSKRLKGRSAAFTKREREAVSNEFRTLIEAPQVIQTLPAQPQSANPSASHTTVLPTATPQKEGPQLVDISRAGMPPVKAATTQKQPVPQPASAPVSSLRIPVVTGTLWMPPNPNRPVPPSKSQSKQTSVKSNTNQTAVASPPAGGPVNPARSTTAGSSSQGSAQPQPSQSESTASQSSKTPISSPPGAHETAPQPSQSGGATNQASKTPTNGQPGAQATPASKSSKPISQCSRTPSISLKESEQKPLRDLTSQEVAYFIESKCNEYKEYALSMIENGIDGDVIAESIEDASLDDLLQSFVSNALHRKVLLGHFKVRGKKNLPESLPGGWGGPRAEYPPYPPHWPPPWYSQHPVPPSAPRAAPPSAPGATPQSAPSSSVPEKKKRGRPVGSVNAAKKATTLAPDAGAEVQTAASSSAAVEPVKPAEPAEPGERAKKRGRLPKNASKTTKTAVAGGTSSGENEIGFSTHNPQQPVARAFDTVTTPYQGGAASVHAPAAAPAAKVAKKAHEKKKSQSVTQRAEPAVTPNWQPAPQWAFGAQQNQQQHPTPQQRAPTVPAQLQAQPTALQQLLNRAQQSLTCPTRQVQRNPGTALQQVQSATSTGAYLLSPAQTPMNDDEWLFEPNTFDQR